MKFNKISILLIALIFAFGACTEPDNIVPTNSDWDGEGFEVGGGLLDVTTSSINYIVGDGKTYTCEFGVKQGADNKTVKVEVYSSFHAYKRAGEQDTLVLDESGNPIPLTSNEIVFKTFDITETTNHFLSFDFTYEDLIANLEIDGGALPTSDGELSIGDYWEFRFVSTTSEGNVYENYKRTNIAVSTRFAGTYKSIGGYYFHPSYNPAPYLTDLWLGETVIISSVDAITYKFEDWGILSGWEGNVLYFQIDPVTGAITYPEEWNGTAQTLNGLPLLVAERNPNDLTYVIPLAGENIDKAIKDDVDGKDQLNMVHGYMGGSGPREFHILLEKVVN